MRVPRLLLGGWLAVLGMVSPESTARAQEAVPDLAPGFTLAQALAAMREGHPMLDYTAARADAAAATVTAARLWENPVLNADYFLGVRSTSYDRAGAMVVGIGQWVPVTAVPRVRANVARHEERAVAADNTTLVRSLEIAVEATMLLLAAAIREVEIRESALVDLEEGKRIVQARVDAGVTPQFDATRMALALAEAEAALHSAEAAVVEARGDLDVAVGPLAARLRGAPRIDVFAQPPLAPVNTLHTAMLAHRPDLAAARARLDAAGSTVTLNRREVFPGFGVRVAAGFGQGPGQVDIGAGISIPIPILNRGQGFIDRARAERRAAESLSRTLLIAAEQRLLPVHQAAEQRRQASQRYEAMSKNAAEALQRQAEAGYRDGRLSVLELVDASVSIRDMRLRDLGLALLARLAELSLRRVVEVGPQRPGE